MKVKVSDSLDNVPNENVVTQLVTNRQSDQLLELLEWLFATKNAFTFLYPGDPLKISEKWSVVLILPGVRARSLEVRK